MLRLLLCALLCLTGLPAQAQTVSRIGLPSPVLIDGLYAAPDGYLYAAGGHNGSAIYQITPGGRMTTFAAGIDGPIHLAMNADGQLFVSSFNNQTIYRVGSEGELEAFAVTLIRYPTGMVFGPDGALYVAHAEPAYGTGGISRIETDGTASIFARRGGLDRPVGLAIDDAGNLCAANAYDTAIFRITPAGEVEPFAQSLPQVFTTTIGHMVWSDGYLYAADTGHHQIVRIDMMGQVDVLAGNGEQASVDGQATAAAFVRPQGIAISPDGRTLYVGSLMAQPHIRTISLSAATDYEQERPQPLGAGLLPNYPNPFSAATTIPYRLDQAGRVRLEVLDLLGRSVSVLENQWMDAGEHVARFDAADLPAGAYLIRFETGPRSATRVITRFARD